MTNQLSVVVGVVAGVVVGVIAEWSSELVWNSAFRLWKLDAVEDVRVQR